MKESRQLKVSTRTIWIIDHYSSEPKYGGISRQYDFAMELGKRGYNVVVIASGFSHFTHSYISEQNILINELMPNVHYVYLKTSSYEKNNGSGRAKNMINFMFKVIKNEKKIVSKFGKPDVVEGCSVHPLTWIAAYYIAKKYKVRFCAEVRDFWPLIWVMAGEKKKTDPMVVFFDLIQKFTFRKADRIICSLYHGDRYICDELGYDKQKTTIIGQPMDCHTYNKNTKRLSELPERIQKFMESGFICSFTGYYVTYEGVYVMLEVAKELKERRMPIKMLFVGSGEEKDGMINYVKKNQLDNVLISERIDKHLVPAILANSDVCMAHLEVNGCKEVYKYGVSKNKINEYLYSGACTLFGFRYEGEVSESGGGMVYEPYNVKDLTEKIIKIYKMTPDERNEMGLNGRRYIEKYHNVEILTDKLLNTMFE